MSGLRITGRACLKVWRMRLPGMLILCIALLPSAAPVEAATIDFTSGTFECSTATLDPITNYQDQGVVVYSVFSVFSGGANVACPDGYPDVYRPALPWPSGISSFIGWVSISATSEIVRIDTEGTWDVDGDGWSDLYVVPSSSPFSPCNQTGCTDYPAAAVRLPARQTTFNLTGLGLTDVRVVGSYGFEIGINEIETVPEPGIAALVSLALLSALGLRRTTRVNSPW